MYDYSDDERQEIISRMTDETYKNKPVDMATFYTVYDMCRIILKNLSELNDLVEKINSKLN